MKHLTKRWQFYLLALLQVIAAWLLIVVVVLSLITITSSLLISSLTSESLPTSSDTTD